MRFQNLFLLILSGEAIFFLPFVLTRIFRPTFLELFEINNFQLGTAFSIYGIIALFAYFVGGPLADKFRPKNLMTAALILTGLGGFYLSTFPDLQPLKLLYGFWGASTILLFWAALIKATRSWGGIGSQGKAFGWLDGGRGLVAAATGSIAVLVFEWFIPSEISIVQIDLEMKKYAFSRVIRFFSLVTIFTGILVHFGLRQEHQVDTSIKPVTWNSIKDLLKLRTIWLQSLIIVCAYVGYKSTDDFSLYAREVLGSSDANAARIGTFALYLRPLVAIIIGWIGDRYNNTNTIIWCFFFMLLGSGALAIFDFSNLLIVFFLISVAAMTIGIYGLRALYFAIMEEGNIPIALTGSAVGLMSLIGYTPDIFWGPFMGYLLDSAPGLEGHQRLFTALSIFAGIGLFIGFQFKKHTLQLGQTFKNR
jgi:nitrate/nitrite transporter NarK